MWIAAGRMAPRHSETRNGHRRSFRDAARKGDRGAWPEPAPEGDRRPTVLADHGVIGNAQRGRQSAVQPVFRDVADAEAGELAGVGRANLVTGHKDAAGTDRPHAGQHLAQLFLAVSSHAGYAENFAGTYVK